MKRIFVALLAMLMLFAACSKPEEQESKNTLESFEEEPETEYENAREFALSEFAAEAVLSCAGDASQLAEICAFAGETATYKVTFSDGTAEYFSFRIHHESDYSLDFFSKRAYEPATENLELGDFFPTEADGYSKKDLTPCRYWEVPSADYNKIENPGKLYFGDEVTGSGQSFENPENIALIVEAMEHFWVIPCERFFTRSEASYCENSTLLGFYENSGDREASYTIRLWNMRANAPDEQGKMFYVAGYEEFSDAFYETYFAILREHQDAVAQGQIVHP